MSELLDAPKALFMAGKELISFHANGDIYIRGEKVESNKAVCEALKSMLTGKQLPQEAELDHRSKVANVIRDVAGMIERGLIQGVEFKWDRDDGDMIHVTSTLKLPKPPDFIEFQGVPK